MVDASGRGVAGAGGATELDGECGITYIGRTYRLHDGSEHGPLTSARSWGGNLDGYQAIVFPHEDRHFSVVIVRPSADSGLRQLRHVHAFDAATRAIPNVREWTSPLRSSPTSRVMVGGRPRNVYRSQRGVRGLVAVGDAVANTTPTAGRGIALSSSEIGALLHLVDAGVDIRDVAEPFGAWCAVHIRPWVEEHLARDDEAVRRLRGGDIDLHRSLTTAAVVDAAQVDARIIPHLAGYQAMTELPASLAPAEPLARAVYESGWRPALAAGPTRDELIEMIARHTPTRGPSGRPTSTDAFPYRPTDADGAAAAVRSPGSHSPNDGGPHANIDRQPR